MNLQDDPGQFAEKFPAMVKALRKLKVQEALDVVDVALYIGAIGALESAERQRLGRSDKSSEVVAVFGTVLDTCMSMDTNAAAMLIAKDYGQKVAEAFGNIGGMREQNPPQT